MERLVITDVFGLSLADCSTVIGVVDSVIYGALFFWEYTTLIAEELTLVPLQSYMFIIDILFGGAVSMESLMCCVVSVVMVSGIMKHRAGFVMAWIVNQVMIIFSSLLTLLYFIAASYLKVPLKDLMYSFLINGYQLVSLVIVYSFYHHLRRGNLRD